MRSKNKRITTCNTDIHVLHFKGDTASLNSEFDNSSLTGSVHSLNTIGQSRSATAPYCHQYILLSSVLIAIYCIQSSLNYFWLQFVCWYASVSYNVFFFYNPKNHPSRSTLCTATHHLNDAEQEIISRGLAQRIRIIDRYVQLQHLHVAVQFQPTDQVDDALPKQQQQWLPLGAFLWPPGCVCVRLLCVSVCCFHGRYARVYASAPTSTRPTRVVNLLYLLIVFLTDGIASLCFGVDFRNATEVDGTAASTRDSRRSASPLDVEHSNSEVCGR